MKQNCDRVKIEAQRRRASMSAKEKLRRRDTLRRSTGIWNRR